MNFSMRGAFATREAVFMMAMWMNVQGNEQCLRSAQQTAVLHAWATDSFTCPLFPSTVRVSHRRCFWCLPQPRRLTRQAHGDLELHLHAVLLYERDFTEQHGSF